MALDTGNPAATTGMTKAIYDKMREIMEPPLGDLKPEELDPIREGWRKLAHAIAFGVVNHIADNAEVVGVVTRGDISATVSGSTATQSNVAFSQGGSEPGQVQ